MKVLNFIQKYDLSNELSLEFFTRVILQSYEFDSNSLFSKDYLCRDLMFLILKETKNQELLMGCEKVVGGKKD